MAVRGAVPCRPGFPRVLAALLALAIAGCSGAPYETAAGGEPVLVHPPGRVNGVLRSPLAVSRDEVWVVAHDDLGGDQWWRARGGLWTRMGRASLGAVGRAVLASDGAVWAVTGDGLVRFGRDGASVRDPKVRQAQRLAAGPAGSVWAAEDVGDAGSGTVVRLDTDGTRSAIGRPTGPWFGTVALAAAPDGTVWLGTGGWAPAGLYVWDGTWRRVRFPVERTSVLGDLVVASDGAVWLSASTGDVPRARAYVARFAGGAWTVLDVTGLSSPSAGPGGGVCGTSLADGAVCVDPAGRVEPVGGGGYWGTVAVAPDGGLWVVGGRLAA